MAHRLPILQIPRDSLKPGLNWLDGGSVALWKANDGTCRATRNRCRHMSAPMRGDASGTLVCPRHGWTLDLPTMTYANPRGLRQEALSIEECDGVRRLYDVISDLTLEGGTEEPLEAGELTLRFYAHACLEITGGGTRLFTDPWLQGPAFTRGWWLIHTPPIHWLERLASADAVFISHNHSDHLNPPTLRDVVRVNPDLPIYVPAYESGSCLRELEILGFRNVRAIPFDRWFEVGDGLRARILQDQTDRDDAALLVDYRGHRILNTVDCHNLPAPLPRPVDVLLTQFTSGASGYPVCWGELLGHEAIRKIVATNQALCRRLTMERIEKTQARHYVPFAGYFDEAHPADTEIRNLNRKVSAEDLARRVEARFEGTRVWLPQPGATLDLANGQIEESSRRAPTPPAGMQRWLKEIETDAAFAPLQDLDGIQRYFDWAGYRGDLVLHVIETSDDFHQEQRHLWIDFRSGQVTTNPPERPLPYLRMRVRTDVFRHVLRRRRSWEEISIGFQARFFRDPDVYHFDFWNHFQNHLPREPVPWTQANKPPQGDRHPPELAAPGHEYHPGHGKGGTAGTRPADRDALHPEVPKDARAHLGRDDANEDLEGTDARNHPGQAGDQRKTADPGDEPPPAKLSPSSVGSESDLERAAQSQKEERRSEHENYSAIEKDSRCESPESGDSPIEAGLQHRGGT